MYVIFDTETTGIPRSWRAPVTDLNNWPRVVQLAWHVYDKDGTKLDEQDLIIKPEGFTIPSDVARIHGITTERAISEGVPLAHALDKFAGSLSQSEFLVAHNINFDEMVLGAEYLRVHNTNKLDGKGRICTMQGSTTYCEIPGPYGYKWPRLSELHQKLFAADFENAHNAAADVAVTAKCFWELKKLGVLS